MQQQQQRHRQCASSKAVVPTQRAEAKLHRQPASWGPGNLDSYYGHRLGACWCRVHCAYQRAATWSRPLAAGMVPGVQGHGRGQGASGVLVGRDHFGLASNSCRDLDW